MRDDKWGNATFDTFFDPSIDDGLTGLAFMYQGVG